jgi:hypothetical protein
VTKMEMWKEAMKSELLDAVEIPMNFGLLLLGFIITLVNIIYLGAQYPLLHTKASLGRDSDSSDSHTHGGDDSGSTPPP